MTATRRVVSVDLGASSGRVVLARWDGAHGAIELVHRFENGAAERDGHLCWDVDRLWREVERGILAAADASDAAIDGIGIDGWAVDYALLDEAGERVAPVFAYRDARNPPAMRRVLARLTREQIYGTTGIQFLPFNTVYQLCAHIEERPRDWERTRVWLNLPEYFLFRACGAAVAEYTNATHTQMVDARSREWSAAITGALGLDLAKFPPIVPPGTILGRPRGRLAGHPRLRDAAVIAPACHDTGSAVAGLPFAHDALAFISCGTWSLVGTVVDAPVLSPDAMQAGFTNEGGVGGTIRLLTNVVGLWLLQQAVEEWRAAGSRVTEASVAEDAASRSPDGPSFDADNDTFLAPGRMLARIADALARAGHQPLSDPVDVAAAIFRSLARRHAEAIRVAGELARKRFNAVCIAGGGVKNRALTAWTGWFTGLRVLEGPSESAALGNAAVQIAALEGTCAREDVRAIARAFDGAARLMSS